MTAKIIDGTAIANKLKNKISEDIKKRIEDNKSIPGLAVIIIGDNPASKVYVSHKKKACEQVGIKSEIINIDPKKPQYEVEEIIQQLNNNPSIHGILVQQPLPDHYDLKKIINSIDPEKDVDGFHPLNIGKLALRHPALRPCTPKGIMTLLKEVCDDLHGLNMCIIGVSNIVGRPMALEAVLAGCTVTMCHRFTKNLASITKQADILISAVGKPKFVKPEMIKQGAVIIDVGITRMEDGSLSGDVDFEAATKIASNIAPVPGGVGPMTVATLLENTLEAANKMD